MSDIVHAETVNEAYGNTNPAKPSIASSDSGKLAVERSKLNLKPRSQPVELSEGNIERGRSVTDIYIFFFWQCSLLLLLYIYIDICN